LNETVEELHILVDLLEIVAFVVDEGIEPWELILQQTNKQTKKTYETQENTNSRTFDMEKNGGQLPKKTK